MVKRQYPLLPDRIVVVERNGKYHPGRYRVTGGVVEVFYGRARMTALLGNHLAEPLAQLLLNEILDGNAWQL